MKKCFLILFVLFTVAACKEDFVRTSMNSEPTNPTEHTSIKA